MFTSRAQRLSGRVGSAPLPRDARGRLAEVYGPVTAELAGRLGAVSEILDGAGSGDSGANMYAELPFELVLFWPVDLGMACQDYVCLCKTIVAPKPRPGCTMVPVIVSPLTASFHLADQQSPGSPEIRTSST